MIKGPAYPLLEAAESWMTKCKNLRWHLLHAEAELANAHWTLKRISGRLQYAEHGEATEDQQALKEIGEWCRKELGSDFCSSPEWIADCNQWRGKTLVGQFAHWCNEWDGLPVDETTPEWPCGCSLTPRADGGRG